MAAMLVQRGLNPSEVAVRDAIAFFDTHGVDTDAQGS